MNETHDEYERLIAPIEAQMIRSVWRIVRDPDDASDALQEALAKIWKRLGQIQRHPNPHALILRICVNASYDVLRSVARRRKREALASIPESLADPAPSASERIEQQETEREIFRAIGRLPRNQAEAVLMRFAQELPYQDIAQALGCSEATVRSHVAKARSRLRRLLAHLVLPVNKEVHES